MSEKHEEVKKKDAYQPEYYSVTPTAVVRFFRVFWPWQFFRFIVINIKMIRMISRSHSKKKD